MAILVGAALMVKRLGGEEIRTRSAAGREQAEDEPADVGEERDPRAARH